MSVNPLMGMWRHSSNPTGTTLPRNQDVSGNSIAITRVYQVSRELFRGSLRHPLGQHFVLVVYRTPPSPGILPFFYSFYLCQPVSVTRYLSTRERPRWAHTRGLPPVAEASSLACLHSFLFLSLLLRRPRISTPRM